MSDETMPPHKYSLSEMRSALMGHLTLCHSTNSILHNLVIALSGLDERLAAGQEAMTLQAILGGKAMVSHENVEHLLSNAKTCTLCLKVEEEYRAAVINKAGQEAVDRASNCTCGKTETHYCAL